MFFEERKFDNDYPYEIQDAWGGKIIVDKEDIEELYHFTKKYLKGIKTTKNVK